MEPGADGADEASIFLLPREGHLQKRFFHFKHFLPSGKLT